MHKTPLKLVPEPVDCAPGSGEYKVAGWRNLDEHREIVKWLIQQWGEPQRGGDWNYKLSEKVRYRHRVVPSGDDAITVADRDSMLFLHMSDGVAASLKLVLDQF